MDVVVHEVTLIRSCGGPTKGGPGRCQRYIVDIATALVVAGCRCLSQTSELAAPEAFR